MSVALPAFHHSRYRNALAISDARLRAKQTATRLRWKLRQESEAELVFEAGISLWSWGEEIKVGFGAGGILLYSQRRFPGQCFDHGKNRQNCEQFALAYAS